MGLGRVVGAAVWSAHRLWGEQQSLRRVVGVQRRCTQRFVSGCASQLELRQGRPCRWFLREIATADCHHVHTCVHYTRTRIHPHSK